MSLRPDPVHFLGMSATKREIFLFLQKIGTRIKIFSNPAPQSTDRVIQIIGEPSKCIDTLREVLSLIKQVNFPVFFFMLLRPSFAYLKFQSPIKGAVNPYDPHNYDEFYANEYGGWGGQQQGGRDRDGPNFGGGPRGSGPRSGPPRGPGAPR